MPRKITIDLGERYKIAFGYVAMWKSKNLKKTGFTEKAGITNVNVYASGNISFEDFTLEGNGFKMEFGFTDYSKVQQASKMFAPPPMLSHTKGKNHEETDINSVDALVLENYGHKPWNITLQGLLIDMENHQYPSSKVREMRLMFETDAIFNVSGQIWDDLGIKTIYFKEFTIAGVQGYEDTMQYTLTASSIKPAEFGFANRDK